MEFLKLLGMLFPIIGAVAAVIGIGYIFPQNTQKHMEHRYGEKVVSAGWAVAQALSFIAFTCELDTRNTAFWLLLIAVIVIFAAALGRCVCAGLRVGAERKEILLTCLAQLCYCAGITITVLFLLLLFFDKSGRRKRRRR